MYAEHALQIIKRMLSMRYIIFSACSALAKDYEAYAQCPFKMQSMRLIIRI
jgi:hypothetical protein